MTLDGEPVKWEATPKGPEYTSHAYLLLLRILVTVVQILHQASIQPSLSLTARFHRTPKGLTLPAAPYTLEVPKAEAEGLNYWRDLMNAICGMANMARKQVRCVEGCRGQSEFSNLMVGFLAFLFRRVCFEGTLCALCSRETKETTVGDKPRDEQHNLPQIAVTN